VNYFGKISLGLAFAVACVLSYTDVALAQTIAWQESVNMFQGETDQAFVDTTGNLAVGYNASGDTSVDDATGQPTANVTVNGVSFVAQLAGTALVGSGGESIMLDGGLDNAGAFGDGEFSRDVDIFHLIRGSTFEVPSVTLGGLEIGQEYLIQIFTNDARSNRHAEFLTGFGDGSGSTEPVGVSQLNNGPSGVDVDGNQIPAVLPETEAGDSIIGTFTPTTSILTFNVFGSDTIGGPVWSAAGASDGRSQINAIQLRRVEEVTSVVGDWTGDGIVDCADLDGYVGNIGATATGALAALDLDGNGTLDSSDADGHIRTLVTTTNGIVGTFPGDLNCDGSVSVLGDAITLVGNLNSPVNSYSLGDINFDGTVSVLGDAIALVFNLNSSNTR